MAIDAKEYPHKVENNLWANDDYSLFFYNFMFEKKRYRGLIDCVAYKGWNKKDKTAYAKGTLAKIKEAKKDATINVNITLDKFMESFFKLLPKTKSNITLKSHYDRYISGVCGMKRVVELRQIHIRTAIKAQEDSALSPRTVKRTLEVLSPAIKNAIANRLIAFNPLDGIKIKQPKTKKIVTNATDELVKIHSAIVDEFQDDPLYMALLLFALQGRRKGEILTLKWEDVSFENSYYVLRNTKNNEEQKIFLSQKIKEQLMLIPKVSDWVFTSRVTGGHLVDIRKATDKLKKRLKKSSFGIHYLRNVMVSAMAEQGFDSIHLSGALGHNDPNTIKKYLTMNYLKSSEMASGVIDGVVGKSD